MKIIPFLSKAYDFPRIFRHATKHKVKSYYREFWDWGKPFLEVNGPNVFMGVTRRLPYDFPGRIAEGTVS